MLIRPNVTFPFATTPSTLLDHILALLDPADPGRTSVVSSIWLAAKVANPPLAVKKLFQFTGSDPPDTDSQFSNPELPICVCAFTAILVVIAIAIVIIFFIKQFYLLGQK